MAIPPYYVDDLTGDNGVSRDFDIYAQYSSARYAKRRELYLGLEPSSRELLRKEIRRIRYFRSHFGSYRMSPKDRLPLVSLLEDARKKWREIAFRRAPAELSRVEKDIDRSADARASSNRSRNIRILRMVSRWQSKEYAQYQNSQSPESYVENLEVSSDKAEDNPREPNYGYNGWIAVWQEGKGGVNMNHPLVHGSFPHQKISMQHLLYNKKDTPLKRSTKPNEYRYFHLPANSMQWVEDAMSRYYDEDDVDFDSKRVLSSKSNAQRLLRNETWRGQQRGGNNLPAHSRQIASRCSVTPSAPSGGHLATDKKSPEKKATAKKSRDFSLTMPYLHWEIEKRLDRMSQFVQLAKSRQEHRERLRRASTSRYKGKIVHLDKLMSSEPSRPLTGFEADDDSSRSTHSWQPHRPIARYIWLAAKLYQIIDEAADGRLIEHHLFEKSPLHMRRTLEQFYYWTAHDTSHRDRDQVVCKATRAMTEDPDSAARIIMVDQLWLWILDDNTVISAFPRRWGRNKPDPSAVHRGIRDRLHALDHDQIGSVYDLAFIVIDECSKVFFDIAKPLDQRPELVDILSSAISSIADKKTVAYEGFGDAVSRISVDSLETVEHLLRRSLNIGFEWSILVEAQQVIDELQIMQEIFTQQATVMRTFERILKTMPRGVKAKHGGPVPAGVDAGPEKTKQQSILEGVSSLISDMEQRREELASMERLQTKTRAQLRELLDMKQQQSNVIEAKAAIQRADESVLQGRSIIVFTIVTIFFLPLSFFTSVFGMNAPELSNDGVMPLRTMLIVMFSISAVVIIVSLALAFSTWTRTAISVGVSLAWASFEDKMGWRNKKSNISSTALKRKQMAKFQQLESTAMARRLTEINSRSLSATLGGNTQMQGQTMEMSENAKWAVGKFINTNVGGMFRGRRPTNKGLVATV